MTVSKFLKKAVKCLLPYGAVRVYKKIRYQNFREEHKSFGELHPDKTFYIIRIRELGMGLPSMGLFSLYNYVLGHIMYALEKNYIPIVDMEHYKTNYNEPKPINGTKNAWEYYFKQPFPYTLEEVYKSKRVILGKLRSLPEYIPAFLETSGQISRFNDYMSKYLQFNEKTLEEINKTKTNLFQSKKNILGVLYRGTDYIKRQPRRHAIIATIDDYINKTRFFLDEWNMEWIYLETEAAEAVDVFRETFGDKLLTTGSQRIRNYTPEMGWTPEIRSNRQHDSYLKGLKYLIDTALLSCCDALIGPKVGGTMAALALNNNRYKNKYLYSLGVN